MVFVGNPLFSKDLTTGISVSARRAISRIYRRDQVQAGRVIFKRGAPAREMFVIRSGSALLKIDIGRGRAVARLVSPGEVLGLPEALVSGSYCSTVVARSRCEVDRAKGYEFARVLQRHPGLCFKVAKLFGSDLNRGRQVLALLNS